MKQFEYIVIGLGLTGTSVVRYLQRQGIHNCAVCDTRTNPPNLTEFQQQYPDIPVFCGPLDSDLLIQAKQLIVSPGVALATPAIQAAMKAGVEIVGDVELFLREITVPVIAITGSNGKTTTTTLVNDMANASGIKSTVGGNIGTPVLDLLTEQYELFVLELSSFQLETTSSLHATAAVVLNVSDNHMDRYETFQDYINAKNRIYNHCHTAVINLDNPPAWQTANLPKTQIGFTLGLPHSARNDESYNTIFNLYNQQLRCNKEVWITVDELSIKTKHHIANLLAAFALGSVNGFKKSAMLQVARTFAGVPHRCQKVLEQDDIVWVNDSKATTVAATTAALESFGEIIKGKIILLAGGDGKEADFAPLAQPFAQYCRTVIVFGRDAAQIAAIVPSVVSVYTETTLADAVKRAKILAQAGDVVLLSPACASTDMFKNFMERGQQFMQLVQKANHA